ncbi:MAG: hypothetical protein Kow0042_09020 [Calditrichia bacterium]
MDEINVVIGGGFIFVAMLIIGLSIPLVKRMVPMNNFYGIRFAKSLESEENWYRINEYGRRQMIRWSIPILVLGILSFFLPLQGNDPLIFVITAVPLIIFIPVIKSYRFARKL